MSEKPRILFVDDEKRVLNAMRGLFRREFELFLTTDGAEAIEIAREQSIDVLVADQRMPGMTGVEVLEQIKTVSPATVRILLTGYADLDAIEASINRSEVFRFLSKPCPPEMLRETLQQAVVSARASAAAAQATLEASLAIEAQQPLKEARTSDTPDSGATQAKVLPFPTAVINVGEPDETPLNDADKQDTEVTLAGDSVTHEKLRLTESTVLPNIGVVVFTNDATFAEDSMRAIMAQRPATLASTLIAVTKVLEEGRAGVLLTDFTIDVEMLSKIVGTLKRYMPELITVVASENRDASDMISLINYGQVFRYIDKPLQPNSFLKDINAAILKHHHLLEHPELVQRHEVLTKKDAESQSPKMVQFVDSLKKIRTPWQRSNG